MCGLWIYGKFGLGLQEKRAGPPTGRKVMGRFAGGGHRLSRGQFFSLDSHGTRIKNSSSRIFHPAWFSRPCHSYTDTESVLLLNLGNLGVDRCDWWKSMERSGWCARQPSFSWAFFLGTHTSKSGATLPLPYWTQCTGVMQVPCDHCVVQREVVTAELCAHFHAQVDFICCSKHLSFSMVCVSYFSHQIACHLTEERYILTHISVVSVLARSAGSKAGTRSRRVCREWLGQC